MAWIDTRKTLSPLLLLLFVAGAVPAAITPADQTRDLLRTRLEETGYPPSLSIGRERIHASLTLPRFYLERRYRLAWSDGRDPLPTAWELTEVIDGAARHGLRAEDYHRRQLRLLLSRVDEVRARGDAVNPRWLVDLDLLLTDAFLIYGAHLLSGRVDPVRLDSRWTAVVHGIDLAAHLEEALASRSVGQALAALAPPHAVYRRLQAALARYQALAAEGGWPAVEAGPTLRQGDEGPRVVQLRTRLRRTEDLAGLAESEEEIFDEPLGDSVRAFQRRHGLQIDGVVGPKTVAALNVSAAERVRQIEVNLERWRWLPGDLGRRYVLVNIAGFSTEVVEEGRTVLEMRAVVGRLYRRTPVFASEMTYLVFSPYWHVPRVLAVEDMLPVARDEGPEYFEQNRVQVFRGWGAETERIDPVTVDWAAVGAREFDFRFRQEPGPANSLGRVKFMFPNPFHVYLHDTPAHELFERRDRAFSSGCIRIERPVELAEYLLRGDARWDRERIVAAMNRGVEQTVVLLEPLPVYILYWTAWGDDDGRVHYQRDVYERDGRVAEALRRPPPVR